MATFNYERELGTLKDRDVSGLMEVLVQSKPTLFQVIKKGSPVNLNKFEWMEKQLTPSSWTIASFDTNGTGTGINFVSTTGLAAGMILTFVSSTGQYRTEKVKIVSVDDGTDVTVTRTYGSTTGVTLVVGDVATGFTPLGEGSSAGTSSTLLPTLNNNYTQIEEETVSLSRNALESAKIGMYDALADATNDALTKLLWKQNTSLIYGTPVARSSTEKGTTGGLIHFLTGGNVNSTGGALAASHINNTIEMCVNDGAVASKWLLVMNTNQAKKLTALNASQTYVTTSGLINPQIGGSVKQFIPDFQIPGGASGGDIFIDTSMPKDMILVVNPDLVKIRYWKEVQQKDATPNGDDRILLRFLTEYGYEIKNGTTAHGMITGLNV